MRQASWLIVVFFVLSGCATVTRGLSNQVQINSSPPGAEARTSMGHQCVTPCTLQFQRRDEFSVVISKAGFHTEEVAVQTRLAGAGAAGFVGNVVAGGVVGMAVDAASGATLEHCPNPVTITLQPANRPRARVDHAAACRVAPTEPGEGQEVR